MLFFRVIIFSLLCIVSLHSYSAEWLAEPTLTVGSTYNDNMTFRTVDEIDATSATLSTGLNSQIKEQVWAMNLDARLRTVQYSGVSNSDSDNVFLKFGSNYRTELQSWSFGADFERNTTFDEDFDTQLSANGLLDAQTEREEISLSPGWNWTMTQSWSMQVLFQTTDTKYNEVNSLDLSDSKSNSSQLFTKYKLDDLSDISLSIAYSQTERDQDKRKSGFYEYDNTSYQLSYKYEASENSTVNIGLGGRETKTTGTDVPYCKSKIDDLSRAISVTDCPTFDDNYSIDTESTYSANSGNTFSLSYNYSHEISDYSIALNRSVTTSSNGFAQEVDDLTIRYNHRISEKLLFGLILNASESTSIDSVSASEDRSTIRIEPSVSWRFTKDSRLSAGYRYRRQAYSLSNVESESNSSYVNLSFFWPRLMSSY